MTTIDPTRGLAEIFTKENSEHDIQNSAAKEPSWFHDKKVDGVAAALQARYLAQKVESPPIIEVGKPEDYDAFKQKMDDRFAQAQSLYDGPKIQRPTLPLKDIHGRRRLYQQEQRNFTEGQPKVLSPKAPWLKMASLGLTALLIGGGAGLAVVNKDHLTQKVATSVATIKASLASMTSVDAVLPPLKTETVIYRKPVAVATLDVVDVKGMLNSQIPLQLRAIAAEGAEPISLRVMGLPEASYLTAGVETTKGNWLLKSEDIAGVKIVVPQMDSPQFDVEIAAVEDKTGVLAAPVKAMTVEISNPSAANIAASIAPASAPPDAARKIPAAIAPTNLEAMSLISKGDGLLNSGDVASARQFYLRAHELGDANGAYGVGRTYDPKIFAALNVKGLQPEPAKAAEWYKKAVAEGSSAARTALQNMAN